jgi:low affinity Fe/Cu permease
MVTISRLADRVNTAVGSPAACIGVVLLIVAVLAWGATSQFGAAWNQVMGAATGLIGVLLLVFLQHSGNRSSAAIHAKLDSLISATDAASNQMLGIEAEEECTILKAAQEIKDSST